MNGNLDKKETYLYGTVLQLVRDNLAALEKHQQGKLGFWGRARANSRNGTIDKFVQKIINHKVKTGRPDPIGEIVRDLTFILQDDNVWNDITEEEVVMLRTLIAGS